MQVEVSSFNDMDCEEWHSLIEGYNHNDKPASTNDLNAHWIENCYCAQLSKLTDSLTPEEIQACSTRFQEAVDQQNHVLGFPEDEQYGFLATAFKKFPEIHSLDVRCNRESKFFSQIIRGTGSEIVLRRSQRDTLVTPSIQSPMFEDLATFASLSIRAVMHSCKNLRHITIRRIDGKALGNLSESYPCTTGIPLLSDACLTSRRKLSVRPVMEYGHSNSLSGHFVAMADMVQVAPNLAMVEYHTYDDETTENKPIGPHVGLAPRRRVFRTAPTQAIMKERTNLKLLGLGGVRTDASAFRNGLVGLSRSLKGIDLRNVQLYGDVECTHICALLRSFENLSSCYLYG